MIPDKVEVDRVMGQAIQSLGLNADAACARAERMAKQMKMFPEMVAALESGVELIVNLMTHGGALDFGEERNRRVAETHVTVMEIRSLLTKAKQLESSQPLRQAGE
jgi:hypothetical protein